MARPYSMDLRDRVVAAVKTGGMSCRQAAAHYGVGVSTAIRWLDRFRTTGNAAPGQMGGHKPKKLIGAHRDWLIERCRARDFTLRGLVGELAERGLPTLSAADIVVADNLGSHKSSAVRSAIKRAGARLILLPKYSPDLNSIEQVLP